MVAYATKLTNTKKAGHTARTGGSNMKGFIFATALALVAALPLASQAEVNAFGVQIPAETQEVSASAHGGYVAQSLSDTFQVQTLQSSSNTELSENTYDRDTYYVFGVALDNGDVI